MAPRFEQLQQLIENSKAADSWKEFKWAETDVNLVKPRILNDPNIKPIPAAADRFMKFAADIVAMWQPCVPRQHGKPMTATQDQKDLERMNGLLLEASALASGLTYVGSFNLRLAHSLEFPEAVPALAQGNPLNLLERITHMVARAASDLQASASTKDLHREQTSEVMRLLTLNLAIAWEHFFGRPPVCTPGCAFDHLLKKSIVAAGLPPVKGTKDLIRTAQQDIAKWR